jgi:probable F420-dependent oxidoreductase
MLSIGKWAKPDLDRHNGVAMDIGVGIRNMGTQSTRAVMAGCARAAETIGFESIWVVDHIAIPPDDAEGSGGRYLDILSTLAWLAGITKQVKLGAGVLILPYRSALPTAKQIATVQELSGNRLVLGVGIGWMDAEFQALGYERRHRGRISDETLAFFENCFASDEVESHGQTFLFKPRPPKPPILVGGRAPFAIERAAKFGDGWFPIARTPKDIASALPRYRELTDEAGKPAGQITASARLPLADQMETRHLLAEYQELGVNRLVCGFTYDTVADYQSQLDLLKSAID